MINDNKIYCNECVFTSSYTAINPKILCMNND